MFINIALKASQFSFFINQLHAPDETSFLHGFTLTAVFLLEAEHMGNSEALDGTIAPADFSSDSPSDNSSNLLV
jgi:hypothetical protein